MQANTSSIQLDEQSLSDGISLLPPDTQISSRAKTETIPVPYDGLFFSREVDTNNVREVERELRAQISEFAKLYRGNEDVCFSFSINLVFESPELYHKIGRTLIDIEKHCRASNRLLYDERSNNKPINLLLKDGSDLNSAFSILYRRPEKYWQGLQEIAANMSFTASQPDGILRLPAQPTDALFYALGKVLQKYSEEGQTLKILLPADLKLSKAQSKYVNYLQDEYAHDFSSKAKAVDFIVKDQIPIGFVRRDRALFLLKHDQEFEESSLDQALITNHNRQQVNEFKNKIKKVEKLIAQNQDQDIESLSSNNKFYVLNNTPAKVGLFKSLKNLIKSAVKTYNELPNEKKSLIEVPELVVSRSKKEELKKEVSKARELTKAEVKQSAVQKTSESQKPAGFFKGLWRKLTA